MLTQEILKNWVEYDADSGIFFWVKSPRNGISVGQIAGTKHLGYERIRIDGHKYMSHRLAWLYVHGNFPPDQLDHVNGIKDDNRLINLRLASNMENCRNKRITARNKSGFKGVHWDKGSGKWRASCRHNGKLHGLGRYAKIEDAAKAYNEYAESVFGEFNPST